MVIQATITAPVAPSTVATLNTTPFIATQNGPFCIQITNPQLLGTLGTDEFNVDDTVNSVQLDNRRGTYIHSDQLARAIQLRAERCGICDFNKIPPYMCIFKCVVAKDPTRVVVLDGLPRSVFAPAIQDNPVIYP